MNSILPTAAAAIMLCLSLEPVRAQDACESFKWDVSQEHRLFLGQPLALNATADANTAPVIELNRLYELTLLQQEQIAFAVPPSKKMLTDGAFAGQLRFSVPKAGSYRVAVSAPFWLDVSADGRILASVDFNGSQGCDTPRKIVVYVLPEGRELVLQLGAAIQRSVRLSITSVP